MSDNSVAEQMSDFSHALHIIEVRKIMYIPQSCKSCIFSKSCMQVMYMYILQVKQVKDILLAIQIDHVVYLISHAVHSYILLAMQMHILWNILIFVLTDASPEGCLQNLIDLPI